jgi:hypothetical protein
MKTLFASVIALSFAFGTAQAQDKAGDKKAAPAPAKAAPGKAAAGKADPNGTWTYAFTTPDGQTRETKFTLKAEGEKLTGSTTGRQGTDSPIEEGSFKNGEVSFKVTRERNGQKFTSTYKGKVDGDLIKGTMTFNRGEGEQSRPLEAKRAK